MSGYDLGSVHRLLGDIRGTLRDISRDCSCSGSSDLSVESLGTNNSGYLIQQLFACTRLLGKCESVLQLSSVEIAQNQIKNTVISLQGEKIEALQGADPVTLATPQIGATSYSGILQQPSTRQVRKQSSTFTPMRGDDLDIIM